MAEIFKLKRRRKMRILLTILVGAFVFIGAMLFSMYGTLSPCEMANKKMVMYVADRQGTSREFVDETLNKPFRSSTPGECLDYVLHP
jgi:hypothetical protein